TDASGVMGDVSKLRRLAPASCGQFLLVFTQCPENQVKPWVEDLTHFLQLSPDRTRYYSFSTEAHFAGNPISDFEFGVVGLLVKAKDAVL
ncbi:MAG TPA: hypothetical protein VL523_02210, partial [Terriglobia bacterium]|nr:hypothetical protein [Terriglobia bacterium]